MAASPARIAEVLAGLRAQTARLGAAAEARAVVRGVVATGVTAIDEALGGGLPRGRLTELVGARGSGRLSLTLAALAGGQGRGELVALVDGADALEPAAALDAGVALERLLWVRARTRDEALLAADRVLDAGGFALVVVYLVGAEQRRQRKPLPVPLPVPVPGSPSVRYGNGNGNGNGSGRVWTRLRERAERSRAAVLVVDDAATVGSFAAATLEAVRGGARWVGRGPGRLLDRVDAAVVVSRSKLGPPGARSVVSLSADAKSSSGRR